MLACLGTYDTSLVMSVFQTDWLCGDLIAGLMPTGDAFNSI